MNVVFFFEGTGQGVSGAFTNVTRLHDLCVADDAQRLHLESGPGTHLGAYVVGTLHGIGWRQIERRTLAWFETLPVAGAPRVYVFGFSRGALIARHFAAVLEDRGLAVEYLGLWDTVDSTIRLDVSETCPTNVRAARHAVARDECRRYFDVVPLRAPTGAAGGAGRVRQMVFPGTHSDVGGLYADDHRVADVTLDWIARGAVRAGLRLKAGARIRRRRDLTGLVLHDSLGEPSNLWGALGTIRRNLKGIRRHALCRTVFGKR